MHHSTVFSYLRRPWLMKYLRNLGWAFSLSSLVMLFSLHASAYTINGNIVCEDPEQVRAPKRDGSVFTFTLEMSCSSTSNTSMLSLKKSVLNRLLENQIHSRDDQVVYDGLPGSKLDMTESLSLPHGDIKTRFETFIVGSSEQAIVVAKSTSIEATGNAKLTQAVKLKAHARKKSVGRLGNCF